MAKSKATTEEVQLVTADSNASHKKNNSPRSVVLHRVSNSFGFTLRHFVVYPPEAIKSQPPNESRTVNGIESDNETTRGQPIDTVFVRQVSPGGPADKAGLASGDQVVLVNGVQVINKSYRQVIDLIQKSYDIVELGIVPKEECVLQMVCPVMSVTAPLKSPPPTKPKPRRTETPSATPTILSTMTIAPTQPSPDSTQSSASLTVTLGNPQDEVQTVVTRRASVDRSAQENRGYVVSGKCDDVNNNSENSSQKTISHEGGTYFFAATDHTGKPKALHFQRGTTSTNLDKLKVVDQSKERSRSLPCVEMEGFYNWQDGRNWAKHQQNSSEISINENSLEINISQPESKSTSQCVQPSHRVVASDSPSTVNVSTNSEFISRQPVAREPPRRPSVEESSSYLVRTISSHMNRDRPGGLQSSTIGATLLESQPNDTLNALPCDSRDDDSLDVSQPAAKIPRQSNQVSVFPNQSKPEEFQLSLSNEGGDRFEVSRNQPSIEERRGHQTGASPRQRRTSYLMATANSNGSKPVEGSVAKPTPTLSSALSSTFMTPMMVHVSSGTESCKDTPKEDALMDDDEIFVDSEVGVDEMHAPRVGRRISYLMATSSSTTPCNTLEDMKEEDEQPTEPVQGLMEVVKEGFLWKKVVVSGGGKRSSVRSWKTVYVLLRGHILHFYKDRDSARSTKMGDGGDDQQPISIKSSIVDIAHDYTKRKNVFRLTTFNGCEYLFQCEDRSSMMKWIEAIQSNNNPDEDESGVTSQSVIIRRMRNVEQESTGTSHTSGHKLTQSTPSSAKMPNFSNLKKSLSFKNISGTQNKEESSKTNKWHKSSKKRKKQPPNMVNYVQGHSIGVPLEMCPLSKDNKCIPILVEHCCEVVDSKGIECVGVYRVPGNSAAVSLLQDEVNSKGAENVNFDELKWHDINNITSLLKQFLRKLPEGVVTAELYEGFIEANKKEDPVERMWALKCLINELPESNYETLKFLLAHLKRISDNADKNKMEARNLAIVFGPTLVRTGDDTMISMVKDMSDQCRIVETLITHNEWFFEESGEGDEPPSKPPVTTEGQDHFVSMSVLSSLGQAAGNFGDDGNIKPKPGGLAHISLHIPKFRGKSKSDSHDSSSPDGITSDDSVSPTLDRGPPRTITSGSCPGSPTQERRNKLAPKANADLMSLSTGSMSSVVAMVDDPRVRGTSSLKAYSYARPPPPSYRKVGPPKTAVSPSSEHPPEIPVSVTVGPPTPENEVAPRLDQEGPHDTDSSGQPTKPTFASLSEETRLRLLKVSLHQKAMEKKRQSESSSQGVSPPPTSPHPDTPEESPPTEPHPVKSTDHEYGSNEQLSSSNTSRSSSTPSSKTASLDSLHQNPTDSLEGRKNPGVYSTRVTTSGGWKASLAPTTVIPTTHATTTQSGETENKPSESSQTIVNVVQGKTTKSNEARRRPSSSDIRARRNTAEGLRVRPSMQSESSDSSSEDEASELKLNMSKTFDEKLKILLDIDNTYPENQTKVDHGGDSSSVSSERSRPASLDIRNRRPSDEQSIGQHRNSTTSLPTSTAERRPSIENKPPERRRVSVDGSDTSTSIQIESKPRKTSLERIPPSQTQPRGSGRRASSETTKTVINVDANRKNGNPGSKPQSSTSKIGRVHTTTPVALKEFKIAGATFRKDLGRSTGNTRKHSGPSQKPGQSVHKDSPIVKAKTEESSITIIPSPRNSYGSPRSSVSEPSPRNSINESPRNSRSEVNINLSRTPKPLATAERKAPSKYAAMAARGHVQPKVMGKETSSKGKSLPRDVARRDILPSKGRHVGMYKEHGREKHAHKLETNAQHIAELLEEMHSERYLKMMRQRSDISGRAQKAAAHRAASRRRRRSLGDENEPNLKGVGSKDSGETKDSVIKTTKDASHHRYHDEQGEGNAHPRNRRNLLKQPGNTKSGKDTRNN